MELQAKRDRRCPEVKIGHKVKILLKSDQLRKETKPFYSISKYEVEQIDENHGLNTYAVDNREGLGNKILTVLKALKE